MRNLYFKETIQNSSKITPFNQRSKLKSLKQLVLFLSIQRNIPMEFTDQLKKFPQQKIFEILQKKMIQDNYKLQNEQVLANQQISKPVIKISKHGQKQEQQKHLTLLKKGNKLFHFFEQTYNKQIPFDKVQREKVNFIEKQFESIKQKVTKKQQTSKNKLFQLKQNLRKKYLQLHKFHQQRKELDNKLKEEIKNKIIEKKNSKSQNKSYESQKQQKIQNKSAYMTLKPPSLKQKLFIMDDTINFMKIQINKIQDEIQKINTKESSVLEEWINFLKLFINYGYYMSNGLDPILIQLKKVKVSLTKEDLMSDFLDQKAKNYLIRYYQFFDQNQLQNSNQRIQENSSKFVNFQRGRIKSSIEMKSLLKDSNLKQIYSHTRQAMTNLLKNSNFKKSPEGKDLKQSLLPKIQTKRQFMERNSRAITIDNGDKSGSKFMVRQRQQMEQEKRQQINRINHLYLGKNKDMEVKGKLMKRILFGFNAK